MSGCTVCGGSKRLEFVCKLCGQSHCADHQLPENHSCPGLETYDREPSWFHTSEATVEAGTDRAQRFRREAPIALENGDLGHLPGKTPDPNYGTSPDVAADGSLASPTETATLGGSSRNDLGRGLWWTIDTHLERYRARPSSLLVDLVYLGVLCGLVVAVYIATTFYLH